MADPNSHDLSVSIRMPRRLIQVRDWCPQEKDPLSLNARPSYTASMATRARTILKIAHQVTSRLSTSNSLRVPAIEELELELELVDVDLSWRTFGTSYCQPVGRSDGRACRGLR